jgi:HEAT repeat protein
MESQENVSSLLEVLRSDKDPVARAKAIDALWNKTDVSIVEPLMHALRDEHWDVRRRAAWALGNVGKTAVEPLIQVLKDEHWNVRRKAAWALGNIKDRRAVKPLINALQDERSDVREQAAWALGNIRDPKAIAPLIHALTDTNAGVRREAARSLAVLTVVNEEIIKTRIHEYESNLADQPRETFQECKKLYEQELTRTRSQSDE